MAHSGVVDGGDGLQIWGIVANVLTTDKGWGLGEGLTNSHRTKELVTKCYTGPHIIPSCCEHGNEPLGSIKGGDSPDQL
jgi:hypothetical protein